VRPDATPDAESDRPSARPGVQFDRLLGATGALADLTNKGRDEAFVTRFHDESDGTYSKSVASHLRYWNTSTLVWEKATGTAGALTSGSGGGGAVTVADGADVAQGTTTDLSSANTVIGLLKAVKAALTGALTANATLTAETTKVIGTVNVAAAQTIAVTQATAANLKVDASGVAVPVTDNSGSLTVDAPVATPVFTRLSDGAAALVGQKAMTASLPVVIASDQSALTVGSHAVTNAGTFAVQATLAAETTKVIGTVNVAAAQSIAVTQATAASLNATVAQGTAAAIGSAWPAKVTDGTNTAKVTTVAAQPAGTDGAIVVTSIDTFAGTVLTSASRGVATVNTDIVNYSGKGIRVWQDLTVLGASSVCQFSIQEKDPVSGKFITLLASAATGAGINSTGTAKLTVYPGLTAAANVTASDVVPVNIRIVSTVATAASTFSIGYALIP
jgi:hypothetical protein